jgi:hypothetical protein
VERSPWPPSLRLRERVHHRNTREGGRRSCWVRPHRRGLRRVRRASFDERIVNPYALFSLITGTGSSLDQLLESHPELVRRIVSRAELKWEIRDKLDQANTTERVLFPGLDGLSRWVARYYAPRETE